MTVAITVAFGFCLSRAWPGHFTAWWLGALLCAVTWFVLRRVSFPRISTCVVLAGWLCLAAAWHDVGWSWRSPREIAHMATNEGVSVRLVAKVMEPAWIVITPANESAPYWQTPERTMTTLSCWEFQTESGPKQVTGQVRMSIAGLLPEMNAGDVISVLGKLRQPADPLNPSDFDYRTWLKSRGVSALFHVDSVECVQQIRRESTALDLWRRFRHALRQRAHHVIQTMLSQEAAGVAETLLLGGRQRLDDELRQAFVDTGMLHVLAISGVNVALLGLWITIICRFAGFPLRRGILISVIGLVIYAAVTDGDPPVVRATIMAVIGAAAFWSSRQVPAIQVVAITLLGMMLVRPSDLFDAGAQLSFLSVLTISGTLSAWQRHERQRRATQPPVVPEQRWFTRFSGVGKVWWECSLVSFGIWLATAPLVAWRFQLVSPIGLLLNVVMGPLIVVLMWSGYSFLIVGLMVPALAVPFAVVFDFCLLSLIRSVTWASSWRFGHLDVASPPDWWMLGYYLGLGLLLLWSRHAIRQKILVRTLMVWSVIGLGIGLMPTSAPGFSCRFLAVGHGLSVLMELPNGKTVLYDAGSLGDPRRAARTVAAEVRRRGRSRLDAVIVSHADADHCNALPILMEELSIGSVLIGPGFLNDDQPLPAEIVERCSRHHIPVGLLASGHQLALHPDVQIRVLHPSEEFYSNKDNPFSLVMAIEYRGRRVLLTGDLEGDGLNAVLRQPAWDCDVLLSPHHGSRAANPDRLNRWATPEWVVVSTHDRTAEANLLPAYSSAKQVFSTANRGATEFRITPDGKLRVETFRSGLLAETVQ